MGWGKRLKSHVWFLSILFVLAFGLACDVYGWAIACKLASGKENYTGLRYRAVLVEQELSETRWVLLFGGSGFSRRGEYQPHFVDLMIKAGRAQVFADPLCDAGFPKSKRVERTFGFQVGISDYEDRRKGQDNDIAMACEAPRIFPRMFTNIDSRDPEAADKIMAEYQVTHGDLTGREIVVTMLRGKEMRLSQNRNLFVDPDQSCKPGAQADILYRHWPVIFEVPALEIKTVVHLFVNASQGECITRNNALNFLWENPGRPGLAGDKYRVIVYDTQVKVPPNRWKPATQFLVDWRTKRKELPVDAQGRFTGGFRKTYYKGRPAIEASFGYGHHDYVRDSDPTKPDKPDARGKIDLSR